MSRGTHKHLAVAALQKALHVAGYLPSIQIVKMYICKAAAIEGLHGIEHAEIHLALTVLCQTVHVVAAQSAAIVLTEDSELIAVVTEKTVARGTPQQTVVVNEHLVDETTGQLIVHIVQTPHLTPRLQSAEQR